MDALLALLTIVVGLIVIDVTGLPFGASPLTGGAHVPD
jgi:hypothetical protein